MYDRVRFTPWKASNEIHRYMCLPFIRLYFTINKVGWGKDWRVYGKPLIQRYAGSQISIGDGLHMRNWFSSNPLGVIHRSILATWSPDAVIKIGDNANMTGVTICAQENIQIGNHIRIGANSTIVDTDFHPVDAIIRRESPRDGIAKAVVIENDVFIGMGSMILKGSIIREGTVIGAGSVVSGEFPPGVVIAGNPAEVVRDID